MPRASDSAAHRDEPVSLAPLTPEEALRALLAVKPDDEPAVESSDDGEVQRPPSQEDR